MVFMEVLVAVQERARANQCFRGLLNLKLSIDASSPAGKSSHDHMCVRVFGKRRDYETATALSSVFFWMFNYQRVESGVCIGPAFCLTMVTICGIDCIRPIWPKNLEPAINH